MSMWGRRPRLRRASRPAHKSAGPPIILHPLHQTSPHRISQNITLHPHKLLPIPNQPVITLILPKPLPLTTHQPISHSSAVSLQSPHHLGDIPARSKQNVYMIGHNHPSMQIATRCTRKPYTPANNPRNLRPLQVNRPIPCAIEQSIHRCERFSVGRVLSRKGTSRRQTSMQPKSHEQRLTHRVNVRQSPLHLSRVLRPSVTSHKIAPGLQSGSRGAN